MTSPIVKWAGGKRRLLPQIEARLPADVDDRCHVELFVGGGALFFHRAPRRALLSDANVDLMQLYAAVRDDVEAVIGALHDLSQDLTAGAFYAIRERFNAREATRTAQAAMFLYLNRTCFNGLYRVNRKGQFNVPHGRYKNPRVLYADDLRAASRALQGVLLHVGGFRDVAEVACEQDDFVYLDPPYVPTSPTANFTSYAKGGFGEQDQRQLAATFADLAGLGCKVLLSNSDTPLVHDLYGAWNVDVIEAPRSISRNGGGRGKVREVLVRNY